MTTKKLWFDLHRKLECYFRRIPVLLCLHQIRCYFTWIIFGSEVWLTMYLCISKQSTHLIFIWLMWLCIFYLYETCITQLTFLERSPSFLQIILCVDPFTSFVLSIINNMTWKIPEISFILVINMSYARTEDVET